MGCDRTNDDIPNTNEIGSFFHCARCLNEKPDGVSPRDWARLEVGWTQLGVQIWCVRHESNVAHIDFRDAQIGINSTAPVEKPNDTPPTPRRLRSV